MAESAEVPRALLEITDLTVRYPATSGRAAVTALAGLRLALAAGECLGLVGESGSGKSQLLLAILGLLSPRAQVTGSVRYRALELTRLATAELNRVRGARIAMVFQDPMTALNPYLRVGDQLAESARVHRSLAPRAAARRALEMLRSVHLSEPERRARQYPHELSGGMRQRVLLALALIGEPEVVLLDEPTAALDVTVQAQILELLEELRVRSGAALLLVTHDLGVLARLADRVSVMYAGRIVEQAPAPALFERPQHPYSEALVLSAPRLDALLPARLPSIEGQPPGGADRLPGCAFAPRCQYQFEPCVRSVPALELRGPERACACFYSVPLSGQAGRSPEPRE